MCVALVGSLVEALEELLDPRYRRGVRHGYSSLVALVLLGCLCRKTELAVLQRWAADHWGVLREPLGFTRPAPPHATTLSRALAKLPLEPFQQAFIDWLADALLRAELPVAAVDGKTAKQGHDADGDAIHVLNVFVHDLKVTLAQWAVGDGKETEPEVLKAHLEDLFGRYPGLHLLTGDALFCGRPLVELIVQASRHYLFAVKDNQPNAHEALQTSFAEADPADYDARSVEKRG